MSKLKVAIVAPSLRILGGQAVQADRLLRAWREDPDVDAWLVPVNPELRGPLRAISRIRYARTIANELVYVPLLARELSKADIVHVFSASYTSFLLAPLPAIAVARALGRPVVLNYRSGEAPDHLNRSATARAVIARVDRNVVPSSFLMDVFGRFGIDAKVIPNIIDLDRFRYRERDPLRPRLLSTRNLDRLYNVGCTLRAFTIVKSRYPCATLTLVGDGAEGAALRRLAADMHLTGVTFAGRVDPNSIAGFYAENDIYIQSPNIDNMPSSVLEAFASGLPVVSTDVGGVPAILRHGVEGLLVPPDDHAALAGGVLSLLDQPGYARALAARALESCRRCTWEHVRSQWIDAYRSMTSATARQAAPSPTHAG